MERNDDLRTDPIIPDSPASPSPPNSPPLLRPPEPEGDPPPSPESYPTPLGLLDWATDKLVCLRTALFVLLGTFGFLQEETLNRFKEHEKSAGAKAVTDSWIDGLWSSKGTSGENVTLTSDDSSTAVDPNVPSAAKKSFWVGETVDIGSNVASTSQASSLMGESIAFGSNVASTSQASQSLDESSMAVDPNLPSTSKKSFWVGETIDFGSNVASTSQESSSMGESSMAVDPNVPSTSKKSFWVGETIDFGPSVASTSEVASCMDESFMDIDQNVPSTSQTLPFMGESSKGFDPNVPSSSQSSWMCESSMDFEPNVASTSQSSSRKRKHPTSTPKPSSDRVDDAAMRIGRDFASRGDPLLKGIEDFCAKYLRHDEVCKQMKDDLIDIETIFVIRRNRKVQRCVDDKIDIGQFMALWGGVKALRNLAEKIVRDQKLLCNKMHYIMRRKARVDQLFRENLSSMVRKDNGISYSMYWIYKNLVIVDKVMERKRKMHVMFETVKKKLQEDLPSY